jgi:hypothetical protein
LLSFRSAARNLRLPLLLLFCLSFRSEAEESAFAVAVALSLWLSFRSAAEESEVVFVVALQFLSPFAIL